MKTTKIYIRLLEGPEVLVPVEAELMENNNYKIVSNEILDIEEDATSIWEFFPGDIVKCVNRKGELIASELVESTFPDHKIHELVFIIVKSLGNKNRDQLKDFEEEIKRLCSDSNFTQRRHPVIKKWIQKNCR